MAGLTLILWLTAMTSQDNEFARQAVEQWLAEHCGIAQPGGLVQEIKTPNLNKKAGIRASFVHFTEFPVAMAPRPPLGQRNVFLVQKEKAEHFKTRETLRKHFVANLPVVAQQDLKMVALEYAHLSAHFSQDGMFQFVVSDKNVSANGLVVTAEVPVVEKGGDSGKLVAKLVFVSSEGKFKLKSVEEKDTIQPGVRPICQCTLLLDDNPIVRKMAERDLLVMGKSAFPYMREQLAKASPPLKREIERVWQRIERGER